MAAFGTALHVTAGILAACLVHGVAAAASNHVFAVTTDGMASGNCAALGLAPPWTATVNLELVGVAPSVRHFDGRHYVVNGTPADNLQIIDATTFATVRTLSFDAGSNPRDVWVVGDGTAFVSFRDRALLLRVDLTSGAVVGDIDLSAFADPDGLPEMESMARDGDHLFVQLFRLDHTATPVEWNGRLAVVDIPTETLVDADPLLPGTQAIELASSRPQFPMQIEGRRLWIAEPGTFHDQAGGIEAIDLDTLTPLGLQFVEKQMGLGHMGGFVFVSPTLGYVLHHTDLLQSSHLVSFSRTTGLFRAEHFVTFGLTETVAFDPPAGRLFFPDNLPTAAGIRVFDAADGTQLTAAPISTGLPPVQCVVVRDATTATGPWGRLETTLRVVPNPTRGAARIELDRVDAPAQVAIFDARGARLRTFVVPPGAAVLSWDGRDGAGRAVAAGVYFAHLQRSPSAGGETARGRIHVVR